MRAWPLALVCVACALSAAAPTASAAYAQPNRITVIGDSVLTAVQWNPQPLSILEAGFPDMDLEIAVCRTLTGLGCPFDGSRPANLVDQVQGLGGQIGATVVVEVGYNDQVDGFADAVDASIQKLLDAGVQRILWVNYHVWDPRFAEMNSILTTVAARYPQVTIVDWESVSAIQYSWFQGDGIHLVYPGAIALATLIHDALVKALAPPFVVTAPPLVSARVGAPFQAQFAATGGAPPYRWRVTSGPLPKGVHLLADGVLIGTPRHACRETISLAATDGYAHVDDVSLTLLVRRSGR